MDKRILIFGKGFMGERIREALNCDVTDKMINSIADAEGEIAKYKPDTIINCIGYTGKHNVDDCETDRDMALSANTFVPIILVEAALRHNIKLVHISSGCIYHYDYKNPPLTEEDIPDFFELYYSRTKIYAERALERLTQRYGVLQVRIRIPLDNRPHQKNLINKLVKYGKVIDVANSVTYIPDFLAALKHLLQVNAQGIYNVVNKNGLRYPELMDVYKKYKPDFNYTVIPLNDLKLVRTNLIMSPKKLEDSGFKVRTIQEVLDECVRGYLGM